MTQLLVNTPSGAQELITIGPGGGYFDESRVIWDEREDGALPEITLGGMVRSGNALEFSQTRKDEHDAAVAPRPPASVTKRQGMAELIDREDDNGVSLLTTVQAVLDGIAGKAGILARNDFTNSQEWQRDWPLIAQLQPILGWSDAFVDELFISAKAR
jgi:hypothetical protein